MAKLLTATATAFVPAALKGSPTTCSTTSQGSTCSSGISQADADEQRKQCEGMTTKWVRWTPPPSNCYKLNTDGAAKGYSGLAGAGGLIRDSSGRWVLGFSHCIGLATALDAELCAISIGLELAWNAGIRNLILETDSEVAIDMIADLHHYRDNSDLDMIRSLFLGRKWKVCIQHVYREGNSCADWLANYSLQFDFETTVPWLRPPAEMDNLLQSDMEGTYTPRLSKKTKSIIG